MLQLTSEEMDIIQDEFERLFPDMNHVTVLHEIESEGIHADIGIMCNDSKDYIILYTLGMSAATMSNNRKCEFFVQVPKSFFTEMPTCELCESGKSIKDITTQDCKMVISDLISLIRFVIRDENPYINNDTIQTCNGNYSFLFKMDEIHNEIPIDLFLMIYITKDELDMLNNLHGLEKAGYCLQLVHSKLL